MVDKLKSAIYSAERLIDWFESEKETPGSPTIEKWSAAYHAALEEWAELSAGWPTGDGYEFGWICRPSAAEAVLDWLREFFIITVEARRGQVTLSEERVRIRNAFKRKFDFQPSGIQFQTMRMKLFCKLEAEHKEFHRLYFARKREVTHLKLELLHAEIKQCHIRFNDLAFGEVARDSKFLCIDCVKELLDEYCAVVSRGYLDPGADIVSKETVRFKSLEESSHGRLIVKSCGLALNRLANLISEDPFDLHAPWELEHDIDQLDLVDMEEIRSASRGDWTALEWQSLLKKLDIELEIAVATVRKVARIFASPNSNGELIQEETHFDLPANQSLSDDDKDILEAMLELDVININPMNAAKILKRAGIDPGAKHKFENLKQLQLVGSHQTNGYWLTVKGSQVAKKIADLRVQNLINDNSPAVCTSTAPPKH